MIRVDLPRFGRLDAWRDAARQLASNRVAPGNVAWADADSPAGLFGADPPPPPGPHPVMASKDFLDLARTVSSHSDPERWALLYAALMRLQDDRGFIANPADPLTDRLGRMASQLASQGIVRFWS